VARSSFAASLTLVSALFGPDLSHAGEVECSVWCVEEVHVRGHLAGRFFYEKADEGPGPLLRVEWWTPTPIGVALLQAWSYTRNGEPGPVPDIEIYDPRDGVRHLRARATQPARLLESTGRLYYRKLEIFDGSVRAPRSTVWMVDTAVGPRIVRRRDWRAVAETVEDTVFDRSSGRLRWRLLLEPRSLRVREVERFDEQGLASAMQFDADGEVFDYLDVAAGSTERPGTLTPAPGATLRYFVSYRRVQAALADRETALYFLGDSLTKGWDRDVFNRSVLRRRFGPWDPMIAGIDGELVQELSWRLSNGGTDDVSPKVVVLNIGTNNLRWWDSAEHVAEGIVAVLAKLRARLPATRVVVMSPFPVRTSPLHRMRAPGREVRRWLDGLGDDEQWAVFDLSPDMSNPDGTLVGELYRADGIHLSAKGYEAWGAAIEEQVANWMSD